MFNSLIKKVSVTLAAILTIGNLPLTISAETDNNNLPLLLSETAILVDADSGQVLFEKDMHKKMYPASITKIMTALLAFENSKLSDTLTMSKEAVFSIGRGSSHIALDVDEQISMEQALYAMALESANDAANGVAEQVGGSLENFAKMMTNRAKELGAVNTNFVNAHGMPNKEHYTTAYDMATITMKALEYPDFVKIFGCLNYEMPPTNKQPKTRVFRNMHLMLYDQYKYDGAIAGKTGWTEESKHTLVTVAKRGNRTLIAVVMNSTRKDDKWIDSTALLDFGFDRFEEVTISKEKIHKNDVIYTFADGTQKEADFFTDSDITILLNKDISPESVRIDYEIPNEHNTEEMDNSKVVLSLNSKYEDLMYTQIGKYPIKSAQQVVTPVDDTPKRSKVWKYINWALIFILSFIIILFVVRFFIRRHYAKKRRSRNRGRAPRI